MIYVRRRHRLTVSIPTSPWAELTSVSSKHAEMCSHSGSAVACDFEACSGNMVAIDTDGLRRLYGGRTRSGLGHEFQRVHSFGTLTCRAQASNINGDSTHTLHAITPHGNAVGCGQQSSKLVSVRPPHPRTRRLYHMIWRFVRIPLPASTQRRMDQPAKSILIPSISAAVYVLFLALSCKLLATISRDVQDRSRPM